MKKKIFRNVTLFSCVSVILVFLLMVVVSYNQTVSWIEQSVRNEAHYVEEALNRMGAEFLNQNVANASTNRLTLIDTDGTVLYDSNKKIAEMDNHENRPEVVEAMENESGENSRVSASLGSYTYYYALRLDNGQVIRMSATTDSVWKMISGELLAISVIIVIMMFVNVTATRRLTERLVSPVNDLDLEHPLENDVYEELSPLLRRIHKQNEVIESQVEKLRSAHQEYVAITDNMKDGLIVTNREVVLSMNKAALRMYQMAGMDYIGKNILFISREEALKQVWDKAVSGESTECTIEKNGKTYQYLANPVLDGTRVQGTVILILDITAKAQAEQQRKDFTANVSHELKTPLMSISGYAELIECGMVPAEKITEFSGRIRSEAGRLTVLVEDIIRLSQLDELKDGTAEREEVDLYELAKDVQNCLEFAAKKKNVTIQVEGNHQVVLGVRQILYEMIYNLCDNGIRYNKEGGMVTISVDNRQGKPILSVKDTGIGIAPENQDRIFERFYRVDKSHSRATGGTGLGLSIVKHGAALHRAEIKLHSEMEKGTEITLAFGSFV